MQRHQIANRCQHRSMGPFRWLVTCVLAGAVIPTLMGAQSLTEPMVMVLKSGLHTAFPGHALAVTVSEVGSATSASEITIEFRDAADRRRGFKSGTLLRNQPVQAQLPIPAGGSQQLRVIVKITPVTDAEASEPIVGMEDLDVNTLVVVTKPPCAPLNPGGKWEANCDGWHATRLTQQQADSLPH
jgi:hypothetical protein